MIHQKFYNTVFLGFNDNVYLKNPTHLFSIYKTDLTVLWIQI